jgi:hypothetical protein
MSQRNARLGEDVVALVCSDPPVGLVLVARMADR